MKCGSRKGFSLIEVVVAIAIMGTALSMLLMGSARLKRQYAKSQMIIQATEQADSLLESWHELGSDGFPSDGSSGYFGAGRPLMWQVSREQIYSGTRIGLENKPDKIIGQVDLFSLRVYESGKQSDHALVEVVFPLPLEEGGAAE